MSVPFSDAIQKVVNACECSELRATALLKMHDNDPERTIEFYRASVSKGSGKIWQEIKPKPLVTPNPLKHTSGGGSLNGGNFLGRKTTGEGASFPDPVHSSNILDHGIGTGPREEPLFRKPQAPPARRYTATLPEEMPPKPLAKPPQTVTGNGHVSLYHPSLTPPYDDESVPELLDVEGRPDTPTSESETVIEPEVTREPEPATEVPSPARVEIVALTAKSTDEEPLDSVSTETELPEPPVPPEIPESTEWDFCLPKIPAPSELIPGGADGSGMFSLRDLVGAMQRGATYDKIQNYLSYYDRRTVQKNINELVEGFPAIFYAVETNNDWILRTWVGYDGDVNAVHGDKGYPLLAFAIVNSETLQNETTLTVATLLSLGAQASVIPKAFYSPFCQDLPEQGPDEEDMDDLNDKNKQWCTQAARAMLAKTLNLAQRYYLEKSITMKKPSTRHKQVALRRNAEALLGIHYFLIGQTAAATSLMQKLLNYMLLPSKRPLVLVFAGPSGHGKTELARRLGHLLGLELEVVDCTIYSRESDLFGHRKPYVGAEAGTPLNNFLARKQGQRCIVFLDEFEKTTADVHKSLLIPFDNGEYQDRRNLQTIDCSKTIWILASNALDPIIKEFCKQNQKAIFLDNDPSEVLRLMKVLGKQLKDEFKEQFLPPLTGRISSFLPFLPFSPGEQAVVAHKYVMELAHRVRKTITMTPGPNEQLLGNVYLRVRRDASVCRVLAQEGYDEDLGARSLITAVKAVIEETLVESYLEVDEEITEQQGVTQYVVDIRRGEVTVTMVPKDVDLGMGDTEEDGLVDSEDE